MIFNEFLKKKLLTKKKYFFRLLLSFFLLVIITVASFSLIFSRLYLKTINDQLSTEYINNLSRFSDEFDNIFYQLQEMYIYLIKYSDINSFLISSDNDPVSINRADIYLSYAYSSNPNLYSIFLYNRNLDSIITAGRQGIDISQFTKTQKSLIHPDSKSNLNLIISYFTPNGTAGSKLKSTISVLFSDSITNGSFDSAVIMNIDKQQMEKNILGKYDGITVIADNSGKVLFNTFDSVKDDSVKNEPYFGKILSSGFLKGNFRLKIDNADKIITYTKSIETDFYIINIRSISNYADIIREKEIPFIIICFAILVFFSTLSFFLSKSTYSPIKHFTAAFNSSGIGIADRQAGEFAIVSKIFQDKNIRLKEDFLRTLLKTNTVPDTVKKEMEDYKLSIEFLNLFLVSVSIDNYSHISKEKGAAYEASLCGIIQKVLNDDFNSETVNMFEGEIAILLNFKNNEKNNFSLLLNSMDSIRILSGKILNTTVTIGIGGVSNKMEECSIVYEKALEMVEHRFVFGLDKIIYKKYLEENLTTSLYYPVEIEDKLVTSIRLNKKDSFTDDLQSIIDLLKKYSYSESASIFFQITAACIKAINLITTKNNNKFYLNFYGFRNIFDELQTLDQAKDWLLNIFDEYQQMMEQISELKSNKHYNLVEKMRSYIDQHYLDPTLSVESIADLAEYSPYYFSKIFKDIIGLNINDYIRKVRINKAKELLETTNFNMIKISEATGFTNTSNFYLAFKTDIGLTPSAYREYSLNSNKLSE